MGDAVLRQRIHQGTGDVVLAGDVGTLYRMGVNGFLMGYLARFEVCGLNVEVYNQRMRAVKVDEIGQPVA